MLSMGLLFSTPCKKISRSELVIAPAGRAGNETGIFRVSASICSFGFPLALEEIGTFLLPGPSIHIRRPKRSDGSPARTWQITIYQYNSERGSRVKKKSILVAVVVVVPQQQDQPNKGGQEQKAAAPGESETDSTDA
jgi:hypothetical protein